jgi:hypothetical protein
MPGTGGSVAWADTAGGVSFALTKNRFTPTGAEAAVAIGNLVARTTAL